MNWKWLAIAVLFIGVVLTCSVKNGHECLALWQDKPDQITAAVEMIRDNPTAAGKRSK
jgi:hypothetical protein